VKVGWSVFVLTFQYKHSSPTATLAQPILWV